MSNKECTYGDDGDYMNIKLNQLSKITCLVVLVIGCGLQAMDVPKGKSKIDLNEQLIIAAQEGKKELVEQYIADGADINARCFIAGSPRGETALMKAVREGHTEICKLLIEKGADFGEADVDKGSALLIALLRSRSEICKLLIDAGANVNAETEEGDPLFFMAFWSHERESSNCFNLLVEHGANIYAKDRNGKTGLIVAAYDLRYEPCKVLIEKGVDVNAQDNEGKTALMNAARYIAGVDIQRTCELLIVGGADVHLRAKDGKTAFDLAVEAGNEQTCQLLVKAMIEQDKKLAEARGTLFYLLKTKTKIGKDVANIVVKQLHELQKKSFPSSKSIALAEITKIKNQDLRNRLFRLIN